MKISALIYSHSVSPRLQYVVDFLSLYYGLHFKLTSSEDSYRASECPCKINYSYHRLEENEIWIHSHVLLFETEQRHVKVECFIHNGYKAFFQAEGEVEFDLLAGIFFLISRYEEYLPHNKDEYGRYSHENSVAYKEDFLQLPLVNIWLEDFRNLLREKNNDFAEPISHFLFLPTYDIDMAWSYKNKGFLRNLGGILKDFFTGKWKTLARRVSVLRGNSPDPFDAYDWMDQIHTDTGLQALFFFLVAEKTGKYDKNISIQNPEFIELIKSIDQKYIIGLHPSWASGNEPPLIKKEKEWLEGVIENPLQASRQHYIRFSLPETYRELTLAGITNDHSMGYGSINGFRASVATAFYWYDLKKESPTSLMVHPFCFMDANSYYEEKISPDKAYEELKHYLKELRSVRATMITIWHNSFLGTEPGFEEWKKVYQSFLEEVSSAT